MKMLKKLRSVIGRILISAALVAIYAAAVFPAGLLMRVFGRDRLRLRKTGAETYWKGADQETDYEQRF